MNRLYYGRLPRIAIIFTLLAVGIVSGCAGTEQITRTYDIRSFLTPTSGDNKEDFPPREELVGNIIELIEATVAPVSWRPDGAGSIREKDGRLIITQTEKNHRSLKNMFKEIREMRRLRIRLAIRMFYLSKADNAKLVKKEAWESEGLIFSSKKHLADFLRDVRAMKSVSESQWTATLYNGQRVDVPQKHLPASLRKIYAQKKHPPVNIAMAATVSSDKKSVTLTVRPDKSDGFIDYPGVGTGANILGLETTISLSDGNTAMFRIWAGDKANESLWLLVCPKIILNKNKG